MANYSEFESVILRSQDGSASNDAGQLDLRDGLYCSCCIKLPVQRRPIADTPWRRHKSSQVNSKPRKIELRSWSWRSGTIRRRRSAPNSGSTKFLRRLKIA